MAWSSSSPKLSRLVGSGCLECPSGHRVAADDGLGALETLAKNILTLESREFDGPKFPLSEMPVLEAKTPLVGGDDYSIEYDYHIPNLQDILTYDPTPSRTIANRVTDAIQNCGFDAVASTMAEMSSIFCNPPRGKTGVMGKDVAPILSRAVPLEMGPFCTTQFQNVDDLAMMYRKMAAYYPNALMQVLNYQRIRDFVSSNYNLASAVAGVRSPRFAQFGFIDRPTSPGCLPWFQEALDQIVGYASQREGWKVCMSQRIFSYWMEEYAKEKGVTLNVDWNNLNANVGDYVIQSNDPSSVTLRTKRRNIQFTIDFSMEPIYVTDNQIGANEYSWNFQPYFETRAGDDTRSGEAAGFVREVNPHYGAACSACPDGSQSLSELILIYNGESHEYEAFPTNPFGSIAELSEVDSSIANIVNSMEMRLFFGVEVDEYFLKPLFEGVGNCPSNIDNTWFAGRIWAGMRTRLKRKRAAGALLVKVPIEGMVNPEQGTCMVDQYSDPITLTNHAPESGSRECVDVSGETPADPEGCLRPQALYELTRPAENTVIEIEVDRVGGLATDLTADYATADGTAAAGTDYTAASGTLTVEEGRTRKVIQITILGGDAVVSDPATTQFVVDWTGDDLCEGSITQTVIKITDRVEAAS